jgi:hypothetical protein
MFPLFYIKEDYLNDALKPYNLRLEHLIWKCNLACTLIANGFLVS